MPLLFCSVEENRMLYWYCPSRIKRLPSLMLLFLMLLSSADWVIPKACNFWLSGKISNSELTVPLISTIATSGSCSIRLLITLEAKRLNSVKACETGKNEEGLEGFEMFEGFEGFEASLFEGFGGCNAISCDILCRSALANGLEMFEGFEGLGASLFKGFEMFDGCAV